MTVDEFTITDSIKDLITESPPSKIPLKKEVFKPKEDCDPTESSNVFWSNQNSKLHDKYLYGNGLGKYGMQKENLDTVFNRISDAIISIVRQEYVTRKDSSDSLNLHFQALRAIMRLIARDIDNGKLKDLHAADIAASLHGFAESYAMTFKPENERK